MLCSMFGAAACTAIINFEIILNRYCECTTTNVQANIGAVYTIHTTLWFPFSKQLLYANFSKTNHGISVKVICVRKYNYRFIHWSSQCAPHFTIHDVLVHLCRNFVCCFGAFIDFIDWFIARLYFAHFWSIAKIRPIAPYMCTTFRFRYCYIFLQKGCTSWHFVLIASIKFTLNSKPFSWILI